MTFVSEGLFCFEKVKKLYATLFWTFTTIITSKQRPPVNKSNYFGVPRVVWLYIQVAYFNTCVLCRGFLLYTLKCTYKCAFNVGEIEKADKTDVYLEKIGLDILLNAIAEYLH